MTDLFKIIHFKDHLYLKNLRIMEQISCSVGENFSFLTDTTRTGSNSKHTHVIKTP